jgi:hypothetical protein
MTQSQVEQLVEAKMQTVIENEDNKGLLEAELKEICVEIEGLKKEVSCKISKNDF